MRAGALEKLHGPWSVVDERVDVRRGRPVTDDRIEVAAHVVAGIGQAFSLEGRVVRNPDVPAGQGCAAAVYACLSMTRVSRPLAFAVSAAVRPSAATTDDHKVDLVTPGFALVCGRHGIRQPHRLLLRGGNSSTAGRSAPRPPLTPYRRRHDPGRRRGGGRGRLRGPVRATPAAQ